MSHPEPDLPAPAPFRPSGGRITLIGAGPGDPELITLKGLRRLREADAVLYDRLAPQTLRDEAPQAEWIDVGKFPGRPKPSQPWINALLLEHAQRGRHVVRLKGGDPFVFGRGGEELLAAIESGIPCEVVPGVTAGIGLPGALGVPVTHRGVSRAVAFVTAVSDWDHPDNTPGEEPQIDQVAQVDTICIYMGLSQLSAITARLIELGRDPETPAMSISSGGTDRERSVTSTLQHLARDVSEAELASPVLTVIGGVVALRDRADHPESVQEVRA